jgi:NADH dehydrogenase (ubiquinone) 1 beta subcomplex subunit 7
MGSTMHATQEQLRDAKVDLAYRDFCAHLLIPLNDCRKANYFLPWRCEHERHVYEKCQYKECVQRVMHDARGSGVPVKSSPPQIERHPRVERPRPSSVEPQNPRDDRQPDRA